VKDNLGVLGISKLKSPCRTEIFYDARTSQFQTTGKTRPAEA
jgi:hypothetical protein